MRADPFTVIGRETSVELAPQIHVCLISDMAIMRAGLRMILEDAGMTVIESSSVNQAVRSAKTTEGTAHSPHVYLLDLDIACESGPESLAQLVFSLGSARVLALTALENPETHQLAVEAGARGIVLKSESPEILIKAIRRIDSGDLWLRRSLLTTLVTQRPTRIAEQKRDHEADKIALLTPREREITELVAEGLNGARIAQRLGVSENTVRNHITSILDKLGLANKLELAVFAFRNSLGTKPSRDVPVLSR